jgi:hypothetical protein
MVCLTIVISPLLLFMLNGLACLFAITFCDEAARQAARAASMGSPNAITKGEAEKNARLALASFSSRVGLIKISPAFVLSEHFKAPLPMQPFGGQVSGEVSVTTSCIVNLPFDCQIAGLAMSKPSFSSTQTYPFTWRMPSASEATSQI